MTPLELQLLKALLKTETELAKTEKLLKEFEKNSQSVIEHISVIKEGVSQDIKMLNIYIDTIEAENKLLKERAQTTEKHMLELSDLVHTMCEILQKE